MTYEVEQKFPVSGFAAVQSAAATLGAEFGPAEHQADRYFNHPGRDFADTDEALRIRSVGDWNCVTYKGAKLDAITKTRQEIEIEFAAGSAAAGKFAALLTALGFRETAVVQKKRRTAHLTRGAFATEITLDDVQGVGQFVELEIVATAEQLDAARQELAALTASLRLTKSERRSYLEMLLAKQGE